MLCTFQVFMGAQAGMTLLIFSDWKSRIVRWFAWSVLTGSVGTLLCLATQNDGWIPVNKNLWYVSLNLHNLSWRRHLHWKQISLWHSTEYKYFRSLSYVMVTTCFAFFLLGVCFFLIDVRKWWTGAPFFYPGIYLLHLKHDTCKLRVCDQVWIHCLNWRIGK